MSDHETMSDPLELLVDPFDEEPDGWHAVLEDAARRRRRVPMPPRRLRLGLAVAAVAGAVALIVAAPWSSGPGGIDAAQAAEILQRTQAALALRPSAVAHARWQVTFVLIPVRKSDRTVTERVRGEGWMRTARPFADRTVNVYGSVRLEGGITFDPCRFLYFDAATSTLYRDTRFQPDDCRSLTYRDRATGLRRDLAAGKLVVAGRATIRGRSVYRLEESAAVRSLVGSATTFYVDAHTYELAREVYDVPGSLASTRYRTIHEIYDFLVWEYLPPTAANLALTDIRRQHPAAPILLLDRMPAGPTRDLVFGFDSGGVPSVPTR